MPLARAGLFELIPVQRQLRAADCMTMMPSFVLPATQNTHAPSHGHALTPLGNGNGASAPPQLVSDGGGDTASKVAVVGNANGPSASPQPVSVGSSTKESKGANVA